DTVVGPDGDNQWLLRGANGGTLDTGVTFSEVENLRGGAAADAFVFGLGGVSGTIDGGGGGGTLDYAADFFGVTVNLQTGTAPFIGGGFSNVTGVIRTGHLPPVPIGPHQPPRRTLTAPDAGPTGPRLQ